MEEGQPFKFSNKRPIQYNNTQKFKNKKKKKGSYYFCGKGHYKSEYRYFKKKQEKMTNKGSSCNVANENLVAMISEINLLEDHDMGW